MNGALSFYECRLSDGDRGCAYSRTIPAVIKFV